MLGVVILLHNRANHDTHLKFPLSDTRDLLKCYLTIMGYIADVTQIRVLGYSIHT